MKERQAGEKYRPVVEILKMKKGLPTKIRVSGQEYSLLHADIKAGAGRGKA